MKDLVGRDIYVLAPGGAPTSRTPSHGIGDTDSSRSELMATMPDSAFKYSLAMHCPARYCRIIRRGDCPAWVGIKQWNTLILKLKKYRNESITVLPRRRFAGGLARGGART